MSKYIQALLAERIGYEKRGLTNRVASVDAELAELGFSHKYLTPPKQDIEIETASVEPVLETAVIKRGRKPKDNNGDN